MCRVVGNFVLFWVVCGGVGSLYSPGCPRVSYMDQDSLKLIGPCLCLPRPVAPLQGKWAAMGAHFLFPSLHGF